MIPTLDETWENMTGRKWSDVLSFAVVKANTTKGQVGREGGVEAEHKPGPPPWTFEAMIDCDKGAFAQIADTNGDIIFVELGTDELNKVRPPAEVEATAEFIVRACNSYHSLLAAKDRISWQKEANHMRSVKIGYDLARNIS